MRFVAPLLFVLSVGACATYREDLNRGQRLYDENQYEHALALWRGLEPDMDSLEPMDQARYAYLRGMTDYRLEFRPDARHWLAIAKAINEAHPGGLTAKWSELLEQALDDLNTDVYGGADTLKASRSSATETTRKSGEDAQPPDDSACQSSEDCPDGQSCQSGECVPL